MQEETPVDEVNNCVLKGDYESDMTVNNQESGTRLRMSVIYGGGLNLAFFVLFGLGAAVVVGICVLPKRLERPEYIFVIFATVMGKITKRAQYISIRNIHCLIKMRWTITFLKWRINYRMEVKEVNM